MVQVAKTQPNYKDTPLLTLTQGNFARGVITLIDQSKLPQNALAIADNCMLYEDGAPGPRWGTNWYGSAPTLPAPSSAPTLAATTGTALGIGTYQYLVTFLSVNGETTQGTTASITLASGSQDVNLTAIPTGISGTLQRNIYRTKVGGSTFYLLTTLADNTTTTYSDTTADTSLPSTTPPTINTASSPIDGGGFYSTTSGANHLVLVAGGTVWRSTNDGSTWTACTGGTFTTGKKCVMTQYGNSQSTSSYLQMVNGTDAALRYNGSTTLQVYTQLSSPTIASVTASTNISGTGYTEYYRISAVNGVGFTVASSSSSGAVNVKTVREQWNTTNSQTNYVTVTWNAVSGALRYDIFVADVAGQEVYIDSVAAASADTTVAYNDYGTTPQEQNVAAPVANTTTGPLISDITLVGSRLWGTGDPSNPYRVWWSGSGPYMGYFSTSYDGGYIDLEYGSQFHPVKVEDYEDGKGDPLTSTFCESADGLGCVWQINLTTNTVENLYSYTVPVAYKLPGSRGTPAPKSVVNVLNDFMYYNSQGFYNLGPRAQFLNLLSTDEASANIRPTVRQINAQAATSTAGHYFLAKVFFSVPYGVGQTRNNITMCYDTEYKAWLPTCFTYGVEQFFDYADNQSVSQLHLLMWKPGDSQLSEINPAFQGDYGLPYNVLLTTGLMPVDKNRFNYMFTEEMQVEFSALQGIANIELIGITRNHGLTAVVSTYIQNAQRQSSNGGWSTFQWSTEDWSYYPVTSTIFSEPSSPGWKNVLTELRSYQYTVTSNTLPCAWRLRTLQLQGTLTFTGQPRQERLP